MVSPHQHLETVTGEMMTDEGAEEEEEMDCIAIERDDMIALFCLVD